MKVKMIRPTLISVIVIHIILSRILIGYFNAFGTTLLSAALNVCCNGTLSKLPSAVQAVNYSHTNYQLAVSFRSV